MNLRYNNIQLSRLQWVESFSIRNSSIQVYNQCNLLGFSFQGSYYKFHQDMPTEKLTPLDNKHLKGINHL